MTSRHEALRQIDLFRLINQRDRLLKKFQMLGVEERGVRRTLYVRRNDKL